jgi:hypothetical protein
MKPSHRNFEGLGRKKSYIPKGTTGKKILQDSNPLKFLQFSSIRRLNRVVSKHKQ